MKYHKAMGDEIGYYINYVRKIDVWGKNQVDFPTISSVQSFSCVRLFATLRTAACQASLSITNCESSLKLMSIEHDAIQQSHPLSFPSFPAFNLSQHQGLLKWDSSSHQVAKELELQLQHQSFSECSGLISFRIHWLDLFVVQGTPKSLLQHHNSKASILQHSAFFIVQLSHPYITIGKTIALTIQAFISKVMSLLSRLVITFLPRSKCLLISWLQSPSGVILESQKIN